jgi:hypothetical protein
VKYWITALAVLAWLSESLALADDFKTINGKEYKNTILLIRPITGQEIMMLLIALNHSSAIDCSGVIILCGIGTA